MGRFYMHTTIYRDQPQEAAVRVTITESYIPNKSGPIWKPPGRELIDCDTECYSDYWLIKFYVGDVSYDFERTVTEPLNAAGVMYFLERYTVVTFNGKNYDECIIALALSGADNATLKRANDDIIVGGLKWWNFYDAYGVCMPECADFIDIMEVAPGVRIGLKAYMARGHAHTIQDLPYDPSASLDPAMRQVIRAYCGNDLVGNRMLRTVCAERLMLRERLGEKYGVDLRSKSDAQMAEAAIKKLLSFKPERRIVPHGYKFQYEPPAFIRFSTPGFQAMFETIKAAWFVVYDVDQLGAVEGEEFFDESGEKIKTGVKLPPELKQLIPLGETSYQLGIGGLHSTEQSRYYHTVLGKWSISDHDVTSYYPSLILLLLMFPAQLGPEFLEIYKGFYDGRLSAKAAAAKLGKMTGLSDAQAHELLEAKTFADGVKILLNGTFGKLFSKYSILFAPELGIRVTLTGQLCLLMLIESLHLCGIACVSANTDGIVLRTPVGREWLRDGAIKHWETVTGLGMEGTPYKALYSRDVNSYVAIKMDGTHKGKGAFGKSGILENSHPDKDICAESVIEYLKTGKPIADTIRACTDIRQFLSMRNPKGGGYFRGQYLGKTVRWYYATGHTDAIRYKDRPVKAGEKDTLYHADDGTKTYTGLKRGGIVAGTTGAMPCMVLPDSFPRDVDYDHYITDAVDMLATLGVSYGV